MEQENPIQDRSFEEQANPDNVIIDPSVDQKLPLYLANIGFVLAIFSIIIPLFSLFFEWANHLWDLKLFGKEIAVQYFTFAFGYPSFVVLSLIALILGLVAKKRAHNESIRETAKSVVMMASTAIVFNLIASFLFWLSTIMT